MKILILAGLLFALLFQGGPPCATATITLGSASLQQGQTQTISTLVTNCGSGKTKFQVTLTVTDAVGTTVFLRNDSHTINGGQSVALPNTYAVAANAPLGTYRVIAIVSYNPPGGAQAVELARDTKEFQVTAAD